VGSEECESVPLGAVLDAYVPDEREIDYVDVDVEGLDLEVLESNDWVRHRPFLLAVETHGMRLADPNAHEVVRFLRSKRYEHISQIFVTAIFRRKGRR
jgi:hypothetical protein